MNSRRTARFLILLAASFAVTPRFKAEGADPPRIPLWNQRAPVGDGTFQKAEAWITVHRPAKGNGAAIVICPGGGYGGLMTGPEGHGIASWLNGHGIPPETASGK